MKNSWKRWGRIIDEQSESGLSVIKFCQGKGLSRNSFYSWRKKIKSAQAPASIGSNFIPVTLSSPSSGGTLINITTSGGIAISIHDSSLASILIEVIGKSVFRP